MVARPLSKSIGRRNESTEKLRNFFDLFGALYRFATNLLLIIPSYICIYGMGK